MPLPNFENIINNHGDPIFSHFYEIHIDGEVIEDGFAYKVSTINNTLHVDFNINTDTLYKHTPDKMKCDEIILVIYNRMGLVLKRMTFKGLSYKGYESSGNWNNTTELVSYKHCWSFKKHEDEFLNDPIK